MGKLTRESYTPLNASHPTFLRECGEDGLRLVVSYSSNDLYMTLEKLEPEQRSTLRALLQQARISFHEQWEYPYESFIAEGAGEGSEEEDQDM